METITDPGLKQKFLRSATKRAQLAYELSQQINRLGGESSNEANPPRVRLAVSLNLPYENTERILKKCENTERESINEYSKALSRINEGTSREVLLRHRKLLETNIKELKAFETFSQFVPAPKGNLKTN